ncbi:phage baseplate assembly protein V [Hartmannibacter diazotrophicus]|uniref:Phage baseplate assembly protein V n=1 Tax=Hartmannibacter diazotrophicus TaxID=1482074 RepID=A0A2C9D5U1_9HYPH|nr:phage baseplate assembly protein V [Hartmannibacter diazotrophicus]SON55529.1 phage baseplate assembly protein V [Hartmannibacter diazotrophicus]
MIEAIIDMRTDIEMLKTAFGNAMKVGTVAVVDAEQGYRIRYGEDDEGEPYLSPFLPHPESGGATSTWAPLSVGQVVGVVSPNGDPRQGVLLRGGFGGDNAAPSSDLEAHVVEAFGVRMTMKGGKLTIDGDVTINGSVAAVGASVTHNDTNIGDSHVHGGIAIGVNDTQTPH